MNFLKKREKKMMMIKRGNYYKNDTNGRIYTCDCIATMSLFEKNIGLVIIHETNYFRRGQIAIAECDFRKQFIEAEKPVCDDEG